MFTKRTIRRVTTRHQVDTAVRHWPCPLAEKAQVDMDYMAELTGKTEEELYADLTGVIFLNPATPGMAGLREIPAPRTNTSPGMCGRNCWNGQKRSAEQDPEDQITAHVRRWNGCSPRT